eukprot:gene2371-gene2864
MVSLLLTYILWLFFGFFGVHRIYLGDPIGFCIYMFFLVFTAGLGNLIFWILDFCLIPIMVREKN